MRLFGLTGGIGMGKSTAGDLLARRGVAVIDTDVIAREVVEPGQPALGDIRQAFGSKVILPNGQLDREELAQIVFASSAARIQLESILHPRIRTFWQKRAEQWRQEQREIGVVIIPLLFETDAAAMFDTTVCVACSSQSQMRRLSGRGWNAEQIRQRMAAQWTAEQKLDRSDYVIWTDTTLEAHAAQLERVFIPR